MVQSKGTKQFWLLKLEFQPSKLLNNEVECLSPLVLWCYGDNLYWADATWLRSLEFDHQNTSKEFLIGWSFPQDEINDPSRSLKLPLKTEEIWEYSDIPHSEWVSQCYLCSSGAKPFIKTQKLPEKCILCKWICYHRYWILHGVAKKFRVWTRSHTLSGFLRHPNSFFQSLFF